MRLFLLQGTRGPCHLLLVTRKGNAATFWFFFVASISFAAQLSLAAGFSTPSSDASNFTGLRSAFDSGKYDLALRQLQSHQKITPCIIII